MADIALVIKIPEKKYIKCKWKNNGVVGLEWWERAIANGTPLEDIKADIIRHSKICDPEFKDAFEVTVQIIDKHIGDTE